jgi:hypothetical protein
MFCKCLTTLTLLGSVTAIAASALEKSGLTSIIGSDWTITAGLVMRLGKLLCCLAIPLSIRIQGSVREIQDKAFCHDERIIGLCDLSFEKGTVRIGVSAFSGRTRLVKAAFPASLLAIEAKALHNSRHFRCRIAVGAFSTPSLDGVVFPASIRKIDPSAFPDDAWPHCVTFEGPPLFLIGGHCMLSVDSRVICRAVSSPTELLIGSNIEVIGAKAFERSKVSSVLFESGTRLREIRSQAFSWCEELKAFTVPESVGIIGYRCFAYCRQMDAILYEGSSRLERICEEAFLGCKLHSITIPAVTEEIDGSAFVNCSLISIQVAPGNLNFRVEGNFIVTSDGTEIVRYFGMDRDIVIGHKVTFLGK